MQISFPWSFCLALHETLKHFLRELVLHCPLGRDDCSVGIRSVCIPYGAVYSQQTVWGDSSDTRKTAIKGGDRIVDIGFVTAMLSLGVEPMAKLSPAQLWLPHAQYLE